ncbi:MAG: hypothetical protein DWQ04_07125 [Chloroflexi bacterium]|nr:MAG: hypothetical protein DWQ04_07125 [Chloroflexota bacterium]
MFDWQTEEEEAVWDDDLVPPPETAVSRRRSWLFGGFLVVLVSIAGVLLYRQVQKQADVAVENLEADIISTHNLVQTAAEMRDADLMRAMLSGRNMAWAEIQQQLVGEGVLWGRPLLNMQWQPTGHELIDTIIDPALESAELTYSQAYEILNLNEVTETISLQYTAVYRRGSQRWLYAPLEDEFWGEWETLDSDRLMLIFPKRDQEIANRLFVDLADIIEQACDELADLNCDESDQIVVRLEKDPASLSLLNNDKLLYQSGLRLELPAPSLVGVPLDDAGYDVLQRGYAGLVVTAVIADAVDWECCEHRPIFQALLDYQLGQLKLQPWSITVDDHIAMWEGEQLVSLDGLLAYWEQATLEELAPPDDLFLQTAVDFLLQQFPHQSPAAMQRLMAPNENISFLRWMLNLPRLNNDPQSRLSPSILINSLDQDWRLFALLQKDIDAAASVPIPLPKQDIQLVCDQSLGDDPDFLLARYISESSTWVTERQNQAFTLMYPTVDEDVILLLQLDFSSDHLESVIELWEGGAPQLISGDGRYVITLGQFDPTGQYLAAFVFAENLDLSAPMRYVLFDLDDCDASGCAEIEVPGIPTWSPSGERVIFMEADFISTAPILADGRVWMVDGNQSKSIFPLYLIDNLDELDANEPLTPFAEGYSAFWLDESEYGFVQSFGGFRQPVMLVMGGEEPEIMLETDDLLELLPESVRLGHLLIQYVRPNPTIPTQLFIVASDIDGQGYIFLVDMEKDTVEYRFNFGQLSEHLLGFSPDGRFLVTTSAIRENNDLDFISDFITIHDIDQNETVNTLFDASDDNINFVFDWSADGNWLLTILDDGLLQLIAPDYNYRQVIEHEFGDCQMVSWVNP